jgi:hypothetical protein
MSQVEATVDATPPAAVPPPLLQITADRAIALARWWLRLGTAFNVLMVAAIFATSVVGVRQGLGSMPAFVAALVWLGVLVVSVRARRLAIDAVPLIAAGEYGLAEDRLSQSLRTFSVLRSTRLLGLQQLALLRHSQNNWVDVAKLCRELIDRQRPAERVLDVPSRLMLSEALIELGQLAPAAREIGMLASRRLVLRDTLMLTHLRLELHVASGRFGEAMNRPEATLGLIELLPTAASARCHALLALAARRLGEPDWHAFLKRRAMLLADVEALVAARPFLREAFAPPTIA